MAPKLAANTEAALVGPVGPVGSDVGPVGAEVGPVGAEVKAVGATLYGSHRLSLQQASSQWSNNPVLFIRVHAVRQRVSIMSISRLCVCVCEGWGGGEGMQ